MQNCRDREQISYQGLGVKRGADYRGQREGGNFLRGRTVLYPKGSSGYTTLHICQTHRCLYSKEWILLNVKSINQSIYIKDVEASCQYNMFVYLLSKSCTVMMAKYSFAYLFDTPKVTEISFNNSLVENIKHNPYSMVSCPVKETSRSSQYWQCGGLQQEPLLSCCDNKSDLCNFLKIENNLKTSIWKNKITKRGR